MGSPTDTEAPSDTDSSDRVPARWAVISFSIFIASMTQMRSPSATSAPALAAAQDRALKGGERVEPRRRARAVRGAPPRGAGGGRGGGRARRRGSRCGGARALRGGHPHVERRPDTSTA